MDLLPATPSVLWYCWLGLLTCKNRLPYNLYCVGGDVKHCSLPHLSAYLTSQKSLSVWMHKKIHSLRRNYRQYRASCTLENVLLLLIPYVLVADVKQRIVAVSIDHNNNNNNNNNHHAVLDLYQIPESDCWHINNVSISISLTVSVWRSHTLYVAWDCR